MRYQDDGRTAACQRLHRRQQALGFAVGQHRSGLVEDQDARTCEQHLQDLDALLFGDRQALGALPRIDVEAELVGLGADLRLERAEPLAMAAFTRCERMPEQDVLGHGERLHQLEVLVHHADVVPRRIARAIEPHRVVVDQHVARLRRIEPGRDVHQRRLAGAVLAEQRVHLAPARIEVRVDQRLEAVEGLADAGELQRGRHEFEFPVVPSA